MRAGGSVVRYRLDAFRDEWIIPDVPVPEAAWHDAALELLKALLVAWVARSARDAWVFRDIALLARQDDRRIGFNPDVCVIEPAPVEAHLLESVRLWEQYPPRLSFEVVSPSHPYKDYSVIPEKCAVTGVEELVVFDPRLAGRRAQGGPWLLQVWQRAEDAAFERVYAGDGPARSRVLDAWLHPDRNLRTLRIAGREDGGERWLTAEEQARALAEQAQKNAELAQKNAELAQKSAELARAATERAEQREATALSRVAELERELARRAKERD